MINDLLLRQSANATAATAKWSSQLMFAAAAICFTAGLIDSGTQLASGETPSSIGVVSISLSFSLLGLGLVYWKKHKAEEAKRDA